MDILCTCQDGARLNRSDRKIQKFANTKDRTPRYCVILMGERKGAQGWQQLLSIALFYIYH